jgi:hypothetical protein
VIAHLLRIAAITAFVTLCTFLPFLPGRYDSMAILLSFVGQAFSMAALLLVPVGLGWMVVERSRHSARTRYIAALVGLVASALVWTLVSVFAFVDSRAFALLLFSLGVALFSRLLRRLRATRESMPTEASALPAYLVVVPVAVVLLQLMLANPAAGFSRNRAIRNSAPLIADIEAHRVANGRYPPSMVSLHIDYHPEVMGIREYRYEPSGDAYNVLFEQRTFQLGMREIVMYNPLDKQAIASHALDVIQLSPQALALDRTRGHNVVYDAGHPHWKYFWFD